MKKLLLLVSVILQLNLFCFSQSKYEDIPDVIYYAINDNYSDFEEYVKNGGDLTVTTRNGMNVPISLAYFSETNFKKACSLLKAKKCDLDMPNENNFSLFHYLCYSCDYNRVKTLLSYKPDVNRKSKTLELTPIQMTQYAEYMFYENQKYYTTEALYGYDIRKKILKNKWYEFKRSEITYGYYGNLILSLFNAVTLYNPGASPKQLLSFDLTENISFGNQTVTKAKLQNFLNTFLPGSEFSEHNEYDDIKETLINCNASESDYIILIQTANSPIAKFQWGTINGFKDEIIDDDSLIVFGTPDHEFGLVEYRVKDISYMIAIKVNN